MNWLRKPMTDGRQWITDEEWNNPWYWLDWIGVWLLLLVFGPSTILALVLLAIGYAEGGMVILKTLGGW